MYLAPLLLLLITLHLQINPRFLHCQAQSTVQPITPSVLPGISRLMILRVILSRGLFSAATDKLIVGLVHPMEQSHLSLSGLVNSTSYKVWVNATDPTGSGLYTRRWYTFTTKTNLVNNPPVFGTPSPANGSTGNLLSLTWSIPINDPEGNTFTWTIQCSNGQVNSGTGASNGTKSLSLSGLANSTSYKVWVNATDPTGSGLYTRRWYTFTTKTNLVNNPPVFGTPSPANGSTGNLLSLTWSIPINDPEGNTFTWTIQCSNGQANSGTGASNGTKSLVSFWTCVFNQL